MFCSGFTLGWTFPSIFIKNLSVPELSMRLLLSLNLSIKAAFRFLLRLQVSLGFSYHLRSMLYRISACWLDQSQTLGLASFRLYYSFRVCTWKICPKEIPFSENGRSEPAVNTSTTDIPLPGSHRFRILGSYVHFLIQNLSNYRGYYQDNHMVILNVTFVYWEVLLNSSFPFGTWSCQHGHQSCPSCSC